MHRRFLAPLAALALVVPVTAAHRAAASPSGLAWDSVTKLVTSTSSAAPQPGTFDADWAAAAAYKPPKQPGGLPSFIKIPQMATAAMQLMQTGVANHHYIAGTKERLDEVALGTATITDCAARTITTLNLSKKTYRVTSLDQGSPGGSSSTGEPQPAPTDDGSRLAVNIKNTSLGTKQVSGVSTTGFQSDSTFTETKPSGQSDTQHANMTAYYSSYDQPAVNCKRLSLQHGGASAADMGSIYGQLTKAISMAGFDKRISVSQSGPLLPLGKLSMFDAATFTNAGGKGATFVNEIANVHPIDATDSVFSVPSDFTEEH